jgi:energy-coupling factor transporter ATP-binding protein EcfA2
MTMNEPIIRIENFSYRYPRTSAPALKNIDLTVKPGEFIGIVGPTGAGKTTLCLALAGLIPQVLGGRTQGRILLCGNDTATVPLEKLLFREADKKALVGLTLQDPEAQLVGMSVEEDLAFGPENLGLPTAQIQKRVDEILRLIRMESFRFTFPYKLSGGEKQRIAIGSTLALLPQLLVLDEPTSELDPIGRKEVFAVIDELKERSNLAIVVVEHHTEELALFADRIWVMNEGEILLDDQARRVFHQTELLRSIGVCPPDAVELLSELRRCGLVAPAEELMQEEEIVRFLSEHLNGRS